MSAGDWVNLNTYSDTLTGTNTFGFGNTVSGNTFGGFTAGTQTVTVTTTTSPVTSGYVWTVPYQGALNNSGLFLSPDAIDELRRSIREEVRAELLRELMTEIVPLRQGRAIRMRDES